MSRREAVDWRQARTLVILAVLILLGLSAIACDFSFGMGEPKVENITICQSLDADYKPVNPTNTFEATDEPCVSVQVSNLEEGSAVKAKWLLQGSPISEVSYTAEEGGSGYVGFRLTLETSLQPGDYVVEVQLDGKSLGSGTFTVVGPPTPIAAPLTPTPEAPPTRPPSPLKPTPTRGLPEMVTYSNWGMSMEIPEDWTVQEESDTLVSFAPPSGDLGVIVAFSQLEVGTEMTSKDLITAFAEGFAEDYPDLEFVFSQEIEVGGVEGFEQDIAATDEGVAMDGIFLGVIPEDRAYIFAFVTPSYDYDAALPIFQAMVDSIEFERVEYVEEPTEEPAPPSGELCYLGEVTNEEEIGAFLIQIWGHVYDVNGDPVPGTQVDIENEWDLNMPVRTDANGGYSQDGIAADIEWELGLPELNSKPLKVKLEFGKRIFVDWREQPCP